MLLSKMAEAIPEELLYKPKEAADSAPSFTDFSSYLVPFDADRILHTATLLVAVDEALHSGEAPRELVQQAAEILPAAGELLYITSDLFSSVAQMMFPSDNITETLYKTTLPWVPDVLGTNEDAGQMGNYFPWRILEATKVCTWLISHRARTAKTLPIHALLCAATIHVYPVKDPPYTIDGGASYMRVLQQFLAPLIRNTTQTQFPRSLTNGSKMSAKVFNLTGLHSYVSSYRHRYIEDYPIPFDVVLNGTNLDPITAALSLVRAFVVSQSLEDAPPVQLIQGTRLVTCIEFSRCQSTVSLSATMQDVTFDAYKVNRKSDAPATLPDHMYILQAYYGNIVKRRVPFYLAVDGARLILLTPNEPKTTQFLLKAYGMQPNDYLSAFTADDIVRELRFKFTISCMDTMFWVEATPSVPSLIDIRTILQPGATTEPTQYDMFKSRTLALANDPAPIEWIQLITWR